MKLLIVLVCLIVSACATRHAPDTSTWYADCYNKKHQESLLARSEAQLSADDIEGRRRIRQIFWNLQKECQ
jgi:hypothetical protein